MKTWKKYLIKMLPEMVCFCMGMIVLLQYCGRQPGFAETQVLKDGNTLNDFKTTIRSNLPVVDKEVEKFISILSENRLVQAMHNYINEHLSIEKNSIEESVEKEERNREKAKASCKITHIDTVCILLEINGYRILRTQH